MACFMLGVPLATWLFLKFLSVQPLFLACVFDVIRKAGKSGLSALKATPVIPPFTAADGFGVLQTLEGGGLVWDKRDSGCELLAGLAK